MTERDKNGNAGLMPDGISIPGLDRLVSPEQKWTLKEIRGLFKDGDSNNIELQALVHFAQWLSNPADWVANPDLNTVQDLPSVHRHLDPSPLRQPIKNWQDRDEINSALEELRGVYVRNRGEDPRKTTPLVAINEFDEPVGTAVLRHSGDPYSDKNIVRTGSFETFLVNPDFQQKGIGKKLLASALEIFFNDFKYEDKNGNMVVPGREVRAWILSDKLATGWDYVRRLFRDFGFEDVPGGNWPEYARKRRIDSKGRDANWFLLTRHKWELTKAEKPELFTLPSINHDSLRIFI